VSSLPGGPSANDVHAVEELLRVLGKGQRALQMYLPNNPVYQRTLQQVTDTFVPIWALTSRLVLDIQEEQITWEDAPVLRQATRAEGLAWQLYKDGLRRLTFLPGVEAEEIIRFLRVVNRARMLPTDATDDLLTLLWEQEFVLISYAFVEALGDGIDFIQDSSARELRSPGSGGAGGAMVDARSEVAGGRSAPEGSEDGRGGGHGTVDLDEFDATPYFLDEAEIRLIRSELDEEYHRDIRGAAIDALLDILESQRDLAIRREVIALLEEILPAQLAVGGFRAVARILRELRLISARAPGLDEELHRAVLSFEERLSTPEILEQLFRVLTDHAARSTDEDVGEVLRELKPAALPVVLSHLGRVIDSGARRVLETSVDAIARNQPETLAALIRSGPDDVLVPAIALGARLRLAQLVPVIVEHLGSGDELVRLAAVRALGELGTPTAIAALEGALNDPGRAIRQAVLASLLARGGSGGLQQRLETMLFDGPDLGWERSERRAIFEAYGTIAGPAGIARLKELLEPRGVFRRRVSADVRASALLALARVHNPEAREVVERFTADKEPVVRSAANAALRDWQG
jgi:HEAT repeat protein